jgi:hypothetical protein
MQSLERYESHNKKEDWEIIKDLARLSNKELRKQLRTYSPEELDKLEITILNACGEDVGDELGDALQDAHNSARKTGMYYEDFLSSVTRIRDMIPKVKGETT